MSIAICIPAHKPRLDELLGCLAVMNHPTFQFIIVTNEPNPIKSDDVGWPNNMHLYNTLSEEINLSKWWNVGLGWAHTHGIESFMVTESDVRMNSLNIYRMHSALWYGNYSMVGPNLYGSMKSDEASVETRQDGWGARHAGHRICQTWMVKTPTALPADERFAWWHADEQHEMRHRPIDNGTAIIGSATYERPLYQSTDPSQSEDLSESNRLARKIFLEEWGFPVLV